VGYPDDLQRIQERAALARARVSDEKATALAAYLDVLRRWNLRSNLTAFELSPPTDAALDRLIVEPVAAARHVSSSDRLLIDIGSGGGSPAVPLRIMAPHLRVVMVEARTRKAVFLREVVRHVGLERTEVANARLDELAGRREFEGAADLVTVRAVRLDINFWSHTRKIMSQRGSLVLFSSSAEFESIEVPDDMKIVASETLLESNLSHLVVLQRRV
jgi:16S rRNA (guanine(527)-N(7))-methyltransferase RsmG